MNVSRCIAISGFVWLAIGSFLMIQGVRFLLIPDFQIASLLWFVMALAIGFMKGRWVLSKTVKRVVNHILGLPTPIRINNLYPKSYYIIISLMMLLGMSFSIFKVNLTFRGIVDAAVGFALIQGAFLYFSSALKYKRGS